ncbi:MAG: hypothetical protein JJ926_03750 [Roseitalea sp.]|nr:hypothetical protein [Roseitalea sp.]MBO6950970.1 hypothetical protein [Rhizobiaceae bacterium]MBO6591043.1 hypothetical protein [Roseitalea sp.]MBO6599699.1 hypothetical protein [Roseitalea sp.]MBO6611455.1 hypothetical protein [Roseitalea sp.]
MGGYLPNYRIEVDGSNATAKFNAYLLSVKVTLTAGGKSDSCEIEMHNPDGRMALPRKGAIIEIYLGYGDDGNLVSQGRYEVEENAGKWGPSDTLTITGKAAGKKSLKESKTRAWNGKTIGQMVTKIAGEHGYEPAVGADIGAILLTDEAQSEESDQHFLHRIAKKYGGLFSVKDDRMVMIKRGGGKTASGKAMPAMTFTRDNTIGGSWTLKPRAEYGKVKATYQDRPSATRKEVEISDGDGPAHTIRMPHATEAEAKAAAEAKKGDLKRGEGSITINVEGDETLQPEGTAIVTGIDAGANGTWSVKTIEQSMTFTGGENSGFSSAITGEKGK